VGAGADEFPRRRRSGSPCLGHGRVAARRERNLKKVLAHRASHVASGEITADSSFAKLVAVWLADRGLENKLAPSTRALYERNMRQLRDAGVRALPPA